MSDRSSGAGPHLCTLCGESISEGGRWAYAAGTYPIGTPENMKRRVHSGCVAQLLRETLAAFARVPESKRDEITFEI
jgi:hypothetical protein